MRKAALTLTTKAFLPGPPPTQAPVEVLDFTMEYLNQINLGMPNAVSLYRFTFELPQSKKKICFILAGAESSNFFGLMDTVLTPNQPNPHAMTLTTVDAFGNNTGSVDVTLASVVTFANGTRFFSYQFNPTGQVMLSFNLTSTDAGGIFSAFDCILWSNPPNPPVY